MSEDRARVGLFGAVVRPVQAFLELEAASGILLLLSTVLALLWANLHTESYREVFEYPLSMSAGRATATFTLRMLINDGLMALFFFVIGMEIKRELVVGELNTIAKASLPAIAAVGGMVVPAGIFLLFNWGGPGQRGWGIPMATDIAFCIGILSLLQDRVPRALIVFVTALAIFDDIGAILVIAFFYGHGVSGVWLLIAGGLSLVAVVMNRRYVTNGLAYGAVGAALWYAIHQGGVHATIAGVVLGLMIPARSRRTSREVLRELAQHVTALDQGPPDEELEGAQILMIEEKLEDMEPPVQRFLRALHPFVAFIVMPAFALANAGVSVRGVGLSSLAEPIALGTAAGLCVGKQVGIFGLTVLATRLGLTSMPGGASRLQLFGVSVIAGIGFTVALFIAALAYPDAAEQLAQAKMGVLLGSLTAGLLGYLLLRLASPQ
jgi:NhaA family Na+:H+ antiporter